MTVATTDRKEQFTIATATTDYDFTFRTLTANPTDIKCTVTDSDDVETALTYTTDYTVSVSADGVGGTVTLVDPASYNTETLTVYRDTTKTQESDYEDFNQFPSNTLERNLDQLTMMVQDLSEDISRSLKLPISGALSDIELPPPEADTVIGWDSAGTALQNYEFSEAGVATLQSAFDNGQAITIADTDDLTLAITNNDVTNNPDTVTITNTGTGASLKIIGGALYIKEQADANADVDAYGQLWVNTATPNELYFTDDAGTDWLLNGSVPTLQSVFDVGQAIVIANTDNQTFSITNNDITNNPIVFSLENDGTSSCIAINQDGNVAGANAGALYIDDAGTGHSIDINKTGDGECIWVDSDGLDDVLYLNKKGVSGLVVNIDTVSAGTALDIAHTTTILTAPLVYITSNTETVAADSALVKLNQSASGATQPCLHILNNSSGNSCEIYATAQASGAANVLIDTDGSFAGGNVIGLSLNTDNADSGNQIAMQFTLVDEAKSYFARFGNTTTAWTSAKDPSAVAEDGWIKIMVGSTAYFIPYYAAS